MAPRATLPSNVSHGYDEALLDLRHCLNDSPCNGNKPRMHAGAEAQLKLSSLLFDKRQEGGPSVPLASQQVLAGMKHVTTAAY